MHSQRLGEAKLATVWRLTHTKIKIKLNLSEHCMWKKNCHGDLIVCRVVLETRSAPGQDSILGPT